MNTTASVISEAVASGVISRHRDGTVCSASRVLPLMPAEGCEVPRSMHIYAVRNRSQRVSVWVAFLVNLGASGDALGGYQHSETLTTPTVKIACRRVLASARG